MLGCRVEGSRRAGGGRSVVEEWARGLVNVRRYRGDGCKEGRSAGIDCFSGRLLYLLALLCDGWLEDWCCTRREGMGSVRHEERCGLWSRTRGWVAAEWASFEGGGGLMTRRAT